jgi:hypothetical protein
VPAAVAASARADARLIALVAAIKANVLNTARLAATIFTAVISCLLCPGRYATGPFETTKTEFSRGAATAFLRNLGPTTEETVMKLALIGAAAVAATAFATPVLAQAVIEDPGYRAQFYPNANCQNLGPGNPYTDGGSYRQLRNANTGMPHQAARRDRYNGGSKSGD